MSINQINFISIFLLAIIIFIVYLLNTKKKEHFNPYYNDSITEIEDEETKNETFDLEYLERRKCIIAISNPENNTYKGTQNTCLGTIKENQNNINSYQPFKNNLENSKYETIYVYTGKNIGVNTNQVKKTKTNEIEFLPTWEIILKKCGTNTKSYLIKNVDTNKFLGCGKISSEASKNIVFLTNKNSLNTDNLWEIQNVGDNEYTIKSINQGTFLYSTFKDNRDNFVTNSYQTTLQNDGKQNKINYNDYGIVDIREEEFNWFIAPLPPEKGEWRKTSHFIGNNYYTNPSSMKPCTPIQNSDKEIIYPWYQNTNLKQKCVKDLPLEAFYLNKSLKPVYILGEIGMSPWGRCSGFKNQKAKWIWYVKDADKYAPKNSGKIFVYIYKNNINLKKCYINCIVDNQAVINVNNKNVGTQKNGWGIPQKGAGGTFITDLNPGTNIFSFTAKNTKGPAGLLVTVYTENNEILFSSGDEGWGYTYGSNL